MLEESAFPQVLQAARLGEEWAWVALYRDLSPCVLRYLRARGAHEPEDLLGEVFVAVVRTIAGFSGDESCFRAWVFTIARSRLTDEWRRLGRGRAVPTPDEELVTMLDATAPPSCATERLELANVVAIIGTLSPDQRDVLFRESPRGVDRRRGRRGPRQAHRRHQGSAEPRPGRHPPSTSRGGRIPSNDDDVSSYEMAGSSDMKR